MLHGLGLRVQESVLWWELCDDGRKAPAAAEPLPWKGQDRRASTCSPSSKFYPSAPYLFAQALQPPAPTAYWCTCLEHQVASQVHPARLVPPDEDLAVSKRRFEPL